jgi:cephalosporin-C deacetylase-like acetyl esterase
MEDGSLIQRTWRVAALAAFVLISVGALACARGGGPTQAVAPSPALFGYDKSLPLMAEEQADSGGQGYTVTKVNYWSANNQQVPAVFVKPAAAKEGDKLPCLIIMHGLGQHKTALSILWGPFVKAGYAIFSIDAQYHGDRKPKVPVDLFGSSPYSSRDMLIQTVIDLRRGIDYLESRKDVDPSRIGYAGFSMGGILGSLVCAVDTRIQAPILALAGGDWKLFEGSKLPNSEKARREHPEGAAASLEAMAPVDPVRWVARIAPRPVLFINGDHDTIVPVAAGKALQEAAGQPKEVFMYKGDHVPSIAEFPRIIEKMVTWLDANVKNRK